MSPSDLPPSPVVIWNHPYALTCLATCVLVSLLGVLVFWKNRKAPAARWWTAMCFFVAAWAFWNTVSLLNQTAEGSLKYLRIADAFALFIPITFLHFTMHFSGQFQLRPLQLGYLATGLIALTVGSPLFVQAGQKKFGIWFEVGGPTFAAFALLFVLLPVYGLWLIWQAVHKAEGDRRAQLSCLFVACALGFGGGFMWFLPALGVDIPPLGAHLVGLYCVVVAYAIVRYRFLDIQVVIRRSIVYSILVTLLTVGYFGSIYLIEQLLRARLGYGSPAVSVTAFALMALLFQPLKIVIQRGVDWLLFRAPHEELVRRMERLEQEVFQAEKLKAVSTLAAGLAHDIKGPLTAIQTFTDLLPERSKDPSFVEQCHEVLSREMKHIQGLVQGLLDFAKPKPPQLKPIDLESLITSTVHLFSGALLKSKVNWKIDCQHNGATVQADADQIRQVLINLIQNAADAMPKGGTLTASTKTVNSHLNLAISDTGQGIPKELLPKIFDPFVTTKPNGTGLGLAMVRTIIKAHHGTIHAASTPGQGATFTVRLPV